MTTVGAEAVHRIAATAKTNPEQSLIMVPIPILEVATTLV
jgi:hypothetical protein